MSAPFCRKDLSAEGLLRTARRVFAAIPESVAAFSGIRRWTT